MPTYVYQCRTCENSFEAEQSIKDAPLTDCACGGSVRRIIQPVGIAFKGSGFYVNDSAAKTGGATVETKGEAPAPAVESAPAVAETKAETP